MNAIGWQIGAILVGASSLIVGIYIARLLDSTTKVVNKANRIIDYNERHIQEIIDNITSITESVDDITSVARQVTGIVKIFKVFRRK